MALNDSELCTKLISLFYENIKRKKTDIQKIILKRKKAEKDGYNRVRGFMAL